MLATFIAFAAEVAEEESEPVAFYIFGGIAAAWAIILFLVGMRSHTFPGSRAAARVVGLISVLVVAAAMASAVLSS
ncbi:MAG TPA: hypothetical protein VD836_04000 [Solirubrobacteraceae bacterium]|nr:hypothetical protein [Solirubrobacteraceae bacterium]